MFVFSLTSPLCTSSSAWRLHLTGTAAAVEVRTCCKTCWRSNQLHYSEQCCFHFSLLDCFMNTTYREAAGHGMFVCSVHRGMMGYKGFNKEELSCRDRQKFTLHHQTLTALQCWRSRLIGGGCWGACRHYPGLNNAVTAWRWSLMSSTEFYCC